MKQSSKALVVIAAVLSLIIGVIYGVLQNRRVSEIDYSVINTKPLLTARLQNRDLASVLVATHLGHSKTIINFWASWCPPCRREMPMLQYVSQQYKKYGVNVIGIAIDDIEQVQPLLDSMAIRYPMLFAEQVGMELMERVGNKQGGLPYTLLLGDQQQVLDTKLGELKTDDIVGWLGEPR